MKDTAASWIVLVVDDDSASADIVARLLAREGYTTRVAGSGVECLRILRTERIDLLLLDVMMPGMDGLQVCAALHAEHSRIPDHPAHRQGRHDTRVEGMHLGVSEFLTKPINRAELLARVRAQLHVVELARQLETVERNLRRPPTARNLRARRGLRRAAPPPRGTAPVLVSISPTGPILVLGKLSAPDSHCCHRLDKLSISTPRPSARPGGTQWRRKRMS